MANLDATELLDKHLKENTANGNMHPGDNWYEKDYREAEDLVWGDSPTLTGTALKRCLRTAHTYGKRRVCSYWGNLTLRAQ